MCLLLNSLKLSKQKHRRVFDCVLLALLLCCCSFFLDSMSEDGMIDGEAINIV
jgi:hypothetical protein